MRIKLCLVVAIGLACMLAGFSRAQEPQQQSSGQEPQQQSSTPSTGTSQSSSLDIQGTKNYLLGPGDVLDIRVFGQPDLSTANAMIDSDGNLSSLPFPDTHIPAKCRTAKQAQKK